MATHALRQKITITLQMDDVEDEDIEAYRTWLYGAMAFIAHRAYRVAEERDATVKTSDRATIRRAGSQVWRPYSGEVGT